MAVESNRPTGRHHGARGGRLHGRPLRHDAAGRPRRAGPQGREPDRRRPRPRDRPFLDGESSPFVRLNRNKESVALDLKSADGKQAFLRLVARADVLVENLRPGAMTGLGFGYEAIREVNPRHRLRVGVRLGAGRPAGRAARAGHHGAGPRRPDEHHRHAGRRPGQDRRARSATSSARSTSRWASPRRSRSGTAPARASTSTSRCWSPASRSRSGRPASTSPPARSAARSARRTRAPPRTRRCGPPTATSRSARSPRRRGRGFCTALGPRGPAGRRALRRRLHAARPPGHPHPRDRGGHHHADHRRGGRGARRGRRALRPDRRLRPGLHRRPPEPARTTSGTRRTPRSGRSASSGRRCGCPGHRPGRTPPARSWVRAPAPPSSGRRSRPPRSTPSSSPGSPPIRPTPMAATPAVAPLPADDRPI